MAYESIDVKDIVTFAVNHGWSIPEFQRGFVWTSTQVRDLAESMWLKYPIGSLLLWNSQETVQPHSAIDAKSPELWVVDGQQRSTAMCLLFGRKPYWWSDRESWDNTLKKYDIRFDIESRQPPYFITANAAQRKVKENRYIPLKEILNLDLTKENDDQSLQNLAKKIKIEGLCDGMDAMEVYGRLHRINKIREIPIVKITVDHELEDVVEIFSRLNSRGTRVTEADIYLGVVAARNPGWVHDNFLPYLQQLKNYGFDISPNLLFRSLTAIGVKKVRFKEIHSEFWTSVGKSTGADPAEGNVWKRTKAAWESLVMNFRDNGILSNDPLPTEAALVTMTAMLDKYHDGNFSIAYYWFLQATRFSRYSGSAANAMEEDLRDIADSSSLIESIQKLLTRFSYETPLTSEDFLRDYTDTRFGRFFLYLMVYKNKALDWEKESHRIGFEGATLLQDYRPQYHHIFPKGYLEARDIKEENINALANIAVIGPTINIRISAKSPMNYIARYEITEDKLKQQYISPDIVSLPLEKYLDWVNARANKLAEIGNQYLNELKNGL